MVDKPQHPEPDKQGDEHVTRRSEQQRIGNLRDNREHGESLCIASHAGGVSIPLAQQIRHNGEGEAAQRIQSDHGAPWQLAAEHVGNMVARHAHDSCHLQHKGGNGGHRLHGEAHLL